MSSAQIQQEWR